MTGKTRVDSVKYWKFHTTKAFSLPQPSSCEYFKMLKALVLPRTIIANLKQYLFMGRNNIMVVLCCFLNKEVLVLKPGLIWVWTIQYRAEG